jgi:endonuclease/exonuclease/phosphatase (EEP) superfamily protein YafD
MARQKFSEAFQWILVGFMITMSLLFLFPPDYLLAKQFSEYAIHWMILCLVIGIIALFFGNERFLYTGFITCGIIAFYLMNAFNTDLRLANFNNSNSFTVLFANLTLGNDEEEKTLSAMYQKDADVLVIEELTPDKVSMIQKMKLRYPHQFMLPRIDPLGKAVLSKFNFHHQHNYDIKGIPVLELNIMNDSKDSFNLVVANCLPPITMSSYQNVTGFLDSLAIHIKNKNQNVIVAANFNLVPWAREVINFRVNAGLNSSRRDNAEGSSNKNAFGIFNPPNNEIFFSRGLECSLLHVVNDSKGNQIGLYGRYQKKAKK